MERIPSLCGVCMDGGALNFVDVVVKVLFDLTLMPVKQSQNIYTYNIHVFCVCVYVKMKLIPRQSNNMEEQFP